LGQPTHIVTMTSCPQNGLSRNATSMQFYNFGDTMKGVRAQRLARLAGIALFPVLYFDWSSAERICDEHGYSHYRFGGEPVAIHVHRHD
jgi:hypothetical protein